jgi:hypothetical protein
MPSPAPAEALLLFAWQRKTFGFDFSKEGAILSGETLLDDPPPTVEWVDDPPLAGAPDIGVPEITTEDFKDSDGTKIKAGMGVACRFSGTVTTAPGDYRVKAVAITSGGDELTVVGVVRVPTR